MSLPYVRINFANGAIGGSAAMDDGCTGIVFPCKEEPLGLITPYFPVLITSLKQLEALGVDATLAESDTRAARLHKCVKEFYDEAPAGTKLYLIGTPKSVVERLGFEEDVKPLVLFAKGEIRTLVLLRDPNGEAPVTGIADDVYHGIHVAQEIAELCADELKAPLLALVEGALYDGNVSGLRDIHENGYNRVAVVIGDTERSRSAAVGLLAGRIAAIPVQRSAARVRDGAVKAAAMWLSDVRAELGDPEAIHDKGFICPRTFAGKAGYYWSDDLIATGADDDYNLIPRRRTIDKAARVAYAAMLDFVNDEIPVTAEGKIVASVAKNIETVLESAIIRHMTSQGNLSTDPDDPSDTGVVAYVNPDQDIVATSHLDVKLRIRPYGYAKYIDVDLGFQTLNQ